MEAIYEVGGQLNLAVTLEDDQARSKSGRVFLDEFCSNRDIPLLKSRNVNDEVVIAAIEEHRIDWLFIIGWSQIARQRLLQAPRLGVLGMHPTLLPIGRGRAAIPWAILRRLERTGVTLFKLDEGVDTGDILDQIVIPMPPDIDATRLYAAVEAAHVTLMKAAYPKLLAGSIVPLKQDDRDASVWPGRRPEDGEIDRGASVEDAECLVRALTRPYPGAFVVQGGKKTTIWRAEVAHPGVEMEASLRLHFHDGILNCHDWESSE